MNHSCTAGGPMKIPQTWHKHYMCMICTNVDTINHQVDGVVRDREHSEPRRGQNAWIQNIHHAWTSEIDGTKLSHREKFTITTLVHQSSEQSPRKYDIGDDTTRWIRLPRRARATIVYTEIPYNSGPNAHLTLLGHTSNF